MTLSYASLQEANAPAYGRKYFDSSFVYENDDNQPTLGPVPIQNGDTIQNRRGHIMPASACDAVILHTIRCKGCQKKLKIFLCEDKKTIDSILGFYVSKLEKLFFSDNVSTIIFIIILWVIGMGLLNR